MGVEPGEAEALAEKLKARIEKRHGDGAKVEAKVEQIEAGELASVRIGLPMTLWPRFAAKLGLAFGRKALGEDWVQSEGAARLRQIL